MSSAVAPLASDFSDCSARPACFRRASKPPPPACFMPSDSVFAAALVLLSLMTLSISIIFVYFGCCFRKRPYLYDTSALKSSYIVGSSEPSMSSFSSPKASHKMPRRMFRSTNSKYVGMKNA